MCSVLQNELILFAISSEMHDKLYVATSDIDTLVVYKKAQLSLTNPRDACEKFARFMYEQWGCKLYS